MKLIGMLDSPYVRRVAICLKLLELDFEHRPVSVFSDFEEFRKLNPVVKAPTLILDDGQSLMDSTLILDYVTSLAGSDATLVPHRADERLRATRLTGLALAACDKTVQIVYERNLRPIEKQHEPWVDRVSAQLLAAYAGLEAELAVGHPARGRGPAWASGHDCRGRLEIYPDDGAQDRYYRGVSQPAIVVGFRRATARVCQHAA
jgi:glutathione S-transferase